jgi:hypothetical protein
MCALELGFEYNSFEFDQISFKSLKFCNLETLYYIPLGLCA